jgi:hypothetical protein
MSGDDSPVRGSVYNVRLTTEGNLGSLAVADEVSSETTTKKNGLHNYRLAPRICMMAPPVTRDQIRRHQIRRHLNETEEKFMTPL